MRQTEVGVMHGLLDRFLSDRSSRTFQAYSVDIEDFARFLSCGAPEAVARLLADGAAAASALVLAYAVDLRLRGRAQSTIARRLATLRALARTGYDLGLVDWLLEVPTEKQIFQAAETRSDGDAHYLFPRHPREIDRLDIQHYALKQALRANYLAPVEAPRRILDVGSGTGQWAFEMCRACPGALVVGFDLVAGKPDTPPGYRGVRGNLLHGLPFTDGSFNFVHQRLLISGVPVRAWPAVVADIVRVTRPGGWVELVEPKMVAERTGPATERLIELGRTIAVGLHLDVADEVFCSLDGYLRDAGLTDVTRREVSLPVGEWGGRVGSLMASNMRAALAGLCELLQARSRLTVQESRALLHRSQEECEQYRTLGNCAIAFGRRPEARPRE
jgi:ubiquinone/menaquinone biosynthesis C-methylase UbiE